MVQLTPEQRTFVIKTFYEKNSLHHIDILYTLDSASNYSAIQKLKPYVIAVSGRSHEMGRFVCVLFLKQGT
jgi:hypothetical protein